MANLDAAGQVGAEWDEAQCIAALAQLEQLQAQIDDLRLAMPRIIDPFYQPPNPGMFKLYARGVMESQANIKALNERWRNPDIQNVFEHTKKSQGANADLSASSSIPSHGWTERQRKEQESNKSRHKEFIEDAGPRLSSEDVSRVVADFQKAHANMKLELQDDNNTITTQFVSASVRLKFRITIEREANDRHKLVAECLGSTEPFLAITRCLASRAKVNDLHHLLDMIAAYKNVKGLSCTKCGKMLDNASLTPTSRRSKQVPASNDTTETVWEAFHENCLG